MKKHFQSFLFWTYMKFHTLLVRIGIALYNTENEILRADPNIVGEKDKKIQRKRHRSEMLEKFYAGQRDEKYVKDYYEILIKSDEFLKKATPFKLAVAADKHSRTYGRVFDDNEIEHEHMGFFNEEHKHHGKTMEDVLNIEMKERRTTDDNYELIYIFNNNPIEVGLSDIFKQTISVDTEIDQAPNKSITKTDKSIIHHAFEREGIDEKEIIDVVDESKRFTFPIKIYRTNENTINKIEQLTEFLHVKKTAFEYRILEFFIPIRFKTIDYNTEDGIFKQLIDIDEVYINNKYGELVGFGIVGYRKRIKHNNAYDVIKLDAIELQSIG